jgi:hypothetical protein
MTAAGPNGSVGHAASVLQAQRQVKASWARTRAVVTHSQSAPITVSKDFGDVQEHVDQGTAADEPKKWW